MNKVSPAVASLDHDAALRARASRVVPGGMWGHQRAAALPTGHPQFYRSGKGARVTDVNGREYIDFMCAWGPMVVGYANPAVDEAVLRRIALGNSLNGPTEELVELAELLVQTVPHADWAMFHKNGTDATTTCVTIARGATGRRKVLVARGAYHGAAPWCTPSVVGVTAEDRAHLLHFEYNDAESLASAVAEAGDDLAAILVAAFRHDAGKRQEMPSAAFAQAARAHCDRTGAALIVDDVRAGFRLNLCGSWEEVGVRADLAAWSKAIANGYPLAAVTGADRFRDAATKVFVTGSFWYGGGPMAAAIATIGEVKRVDGPALMRAAGERFAEGLREQATRHGFAIEMSGPPAMPHLHFEGDDAALSLCDAFCQEALARGVYLHHRHNMFLSTAHDEAVIGAALDATDQAFAALARKRIA